MYVITIKTDHRCKTVPYIQELLTEYGEDIKIRLGLHELCKKNEGVILLIYCGKNIEKFLEKLNDFSNVEAKYMEI